jgi:HK97 family phage major capsid protein
MERMDGTDQARNAATAIVERNGDDIAQWAIAASAPAYVRAFSKVLANPERGHLSWTAEESEAYRTLERIGSTTNAAGGFAVPTALDPAFILDNVGTSNPYRQISRVEQLGPDGGNVWNGVTSAGVTLSWDTEGGEVSDDSPTLARAAIPIFRLAGFVGASFELIDDAPGYAQEVSRIFMDAVDVAESTAFTKGNGTSEPQGIVTAVYAETSRRSNHATNSTMTVSDIANAQQTLGPRWQSRASWTGSLTYLNRVRQLGSSSYSSWTATLDESISNSILGRPAYEVSDMSTALSSITNTAFVYGDFSHFVIVDKVGGTRLNYVPMLFGGAGRPTGQAGWFLYKRTGSEAVTTTAFVVSSNPGA